jgi:deoxyribodipyrimidine photolyase
MLPALQGGQAAHRSMLWFRKGHRLHDNPALIAGCQGAVLAPVFVLDPWFITPQRVGVNRLSFLLDSLRGAGPALLLKVLGLSVCVTAQVACIVSKGGGLNHREGAGYLYHES